MLQKLIHKIFGSSEQKPVHEPTEPLDTIIWPTIEEMDSMDIPLYKVAQVNYDGKNYYRFAPSTDGVESHPETRKIAERLNFPGKWDKLEGHPVALDVFVRELVQKGYDPSKVEDVKGCDAQYNQPDVEAVKSGSKSMVPFYVHGMSSTFGPPTMWLKMDMISSDPSHLNLYFEKPR